MQIEITLDLNFQFEQKLLLVPEMRVLVDEVKSAFAYWNGS